MLVTTEAIRSYLPLQSPFGFGAADWTAFALGATGLAAIALLRPRPSVLEPILRRASTFLENRSLWFFFGLTLVLRLLLLPTHPVPIPSGADDFGYLLLGDTFAHGRLANPPNLNAAFFETVFVLQQPTYSSIFPPAQGMILALGQCIFGFPWAGVLLSMSLLVALCHWMLRGWLGPRWAGVGALLAVFSFGPLCAWMNCYWGGAPAAIAGCLVFGSLARLRHSQRQTYALIAGLGLGWHLLARPFETALLGLSVILFWAMFLRSGASGSRSWRQAALFATGLTPGIAILLLHSHAVTGDWTKLPYMLSREQYGVPTTFTFQANPIPARTLTLDQKNDYDAQVATHGDGRETLSRFTARLLFRLRFLRFFAPAPLYLALLFALWSLRRKAARSKETLWATATVALFLAGTGIYPYFYPHYIAALTSVLLLLTLIGLRAIRNPSEPRPSGSDRLAETNQYRGRSLTVAALKAWAAAWLFALCALQFTFWYSIQISGKPALILGPGRFETWDYLNFGDPQGRVSIDAKLRDADGKQLVFVRYSSTHGFVEWIDNPADIAGARVVRARDIGVSENLILIRRFPERTVWLLQPDLHPLQVRPYPYLLDDMMILPQSGPAPPSAPPVKPGKSNKVSDWLEDVK